MVRDEIISAWALTLFVLSLDGQCKSLSVWNKQQAVFHAFLFGKHIVCEPYIEMFIETQWKARHPHRYINMNALSNAHRWRGSDEPPHVGLTSNVLPEASCSKTGVSSDYAVKEGHEWYVLRVVYNRVQAAYGRIVAAEVAFYQPMHYILEKNGIGKKRRTKKPLFPNLVFVYATREVATGLVRQSGEEKPVLKFYLDKTRSLENNGKHPPLVISHSVMQNFIRVTSTESVHVRVVRPERCRYRNGDMVRVVKGVFEGVVGRVARIADQQRVVVEVGELGNVATAYVPEEFLRSEHEGQ